MSDKRVFNFSDSVFIALDTCEVFALEIHPDSLMLGIVKEAQNYFDESYYRDLLSDEEFDRFKERFKKINGYDFDELNNKNPLFVQQMLEPDYDKPDDKQTFVDAYLYSVAKMLGKQIAGLEEFEEQTAQIKGISKSDQKKMIMESLDYPEEFSKIMREEMVKTYATGELDKVKQFLGNSTYNDSLMIMRNQVMTKSIIEVIQNKTLFSAIGAAHLIGKGSVIQMLKEQGYRVTPVASTFTGVADKYVPDIMKMPWETYTDSLIGLNVTLPGSPSKLATDFAEMMMYMDLGTESVYSFMNTDARNSSDSFNVEKMIELFTSNLDGKKIKIISQEIIESKYGEKIDILLNQSKNEHLRAQISKVNGFIYYFFNWGKKENLYSPAAERFFESISYFTPTAPKLTSGWFTYSDSINAFSIHLPSQPKLVIQEVENPNNPEGEKYKVDIIYCTDLNTYTNYIVAYNDMPNGTYMEDTEGGFNALIEEFKNNNNDMLEIDTLEEMGVPGRFLKCIIKGEFHTQIKIFQRGNRTYKVLKQNLKPHVDTFNDDDFLNSFVFLPYTQPTFISQKAKFENEIFIEFENPLSSLSDSIDYDSYFDESFTSYSKNKKSGGMYQVEIYRINDFFRIENLDSFYSTFCENLLNWSDTLIYTKRPFINERERFECVQKLIGSDVYTRYQYWVNNDVCYFLGVSSNLEELESDLANTFFNSFNDNQGGKPLDYYSSKAQSIIDGLNSNDPLVNKKSKAALENYYVFQKDELPILHNSIINSYSDDASISGVKSKLIHAIGILKSEESLNHLIPIYNSPETSPAIKEAVLGALIDIDTDGSITAFTDLLFNSPPDSVENGWKIFSPFTDSIGLLKSNISRLTTLYKNDNYQPRILQTLIIALESNKDSVYSEIEPYFDLLTNSAIEELNTFILDQKENPDEYNYNPNLYHYITLMNTCVNKPITDQYTNLFATKDTFDYTKALALSSRIRNNLGIDLELRNRLIDSLSVRGLFFETYNDINKLDQFPSKYLETKELAILKLYNYLEDEDYYYSVQIDYLGELQSNNQHFLAFKISYIDSAEEYWAVCGPIVGENKSSIYKNMKIFLDWTLYDGEWSKMAKDIIDKSDDSLNK